MYAEHVMLRLREAYGEGYLPAPYAKIRQGWIGHEI